MVDSLRHKAGTLILETKLYIPNWRTGFVSRPRLIERMNQGMERKLTLISAPAGFGKTTLLAEWLAAAPASKRTAAWVSLDQSDNDPTLFWTYFISALQKVLPGIGKSAFSLLHSPQQVPIDSVLTTLINEINAIKHSPSTSSGQRFALVLDDYHIIDTPQIHNAITFLLNHLPRQMQLVIASRSDPPLPLASFRGRSELTEVRAADLRFTPDEGTAFLNEVMGLELSASDLAILEKRTEGWIAGLQLAALSMQGRADNHSFVKTFAGDDRYIVDYLVEEVLQRQPEATRSFLLQTSILDKLSGPLCDAVIGREDSQKVLAALERDNLFVVPLDNKRHWYRYHHLFADVLRVNLMAEQPEQVSSLRRRAVAWFEEHGMTSEAIEQARAANEHETVARILSANASEFEHIGRHASVTSWSSSLPEEMIRKKPRLALIYASSALISEDNNQLARKLTSWAEEAINEIERSGGFDTSDDVDRTVVGPEGLEALKGELLTLKLFHSGQRLPLAEAEETANQALELLPQTKHRLRGMLHLFSAGLQAHRGDRKSGLRKFENVIKEARRVRNKPLLISGLTARGTVCMTLGRLEDGCRSFEEAIQTGQNVSAEADMLMCLPNTRLAEILLERGELAVATKHAAQALELTDKSPMRSSVLYAWATAAQVFLAVGHIKKAMEQLEKAQEFVRGSSDSRYVSFLSSVKLRIFCRNADLAASAAVVRDRSLSPQVAVDYDNEEEMTAYARYLIAQGDYEDALQVLAKVLRVVQGVSHVQHEIHALALSALAYEQVGEKTLALESLGRASMLGEPGRFNRTFTCENPMMTALLEALADAAKHDNGLSEVASAPYLNYLLREARRTPKTVQAQTAAAIPVGSLTPRELEILCLITAGMRNQEIADHLFISLHTVKRHIANVYGKLGVSHRTEAVALANELDLV